MDGVIVHGNVGSKFAVGFSLILGSVSGLCLLM